VLAPASPVPPALPPAAQEQRMQTSAELNMKSWMKGGVGAPDDLRSQLGVQRSSMESDSDEGEGEELARSSQLFPGSGLF